MADLSPETAARLWQTSRPTAGSLVPIYLDRCGITIEPPPAIRYHVAVKHAATGLHLPAMLAKVVDSSGVPIGVHVVYLRMDGRGRAGVATTEIITGDFVGGGVYLGLPAPRMAVAIGIEAGLANMQATGTPAVAALSADGLKSLVLPAVVRDVTITAAGEQQAVKAAAERFEKEGRRVRLATTFDDADGRMGA